jgi:hypothetical protein
MEEVEPELLSVSQVKKETKHVKVNQFPLLKKPLAKYFNRVLYEGRSVVKSARIKKARSSLADVAYEFHSIVVVSHSSKHANLLLKEFRETLTSFRCVKLFAKHIKSQAQAVALRKHQKERICGVGTPNRILKLLQDGSMTLSEPLVVVDGRINVKGYNMLNIRDFAADTAALVELVLEQGGKLLVLRPNDTL